MEVPMAGLITARTTVREAVTRYPGAERIFDKYGLTGCGGPDGPVEPVGFFAAVHHVDPAELVRELDEYASSLSAPPAHRHGTMDVTAAQPYRLFVVTALAITLVAGVSSGIASAMTGGGWGALRGEAWLAMVQTHGHMQVFGFLGLFVMGMAYHILPRFKALPPPSRGVVLATYWLMTAGVLLRASAQPHGQGFVRWMLGASAPLELAGAVLFAAVVGRLFWQARARSEPFDRFIMAALAWFVALSAINAYLVIDAAIAGERVLNLAGDAALLEAAIYGFLVLFVLGVSMRVLPFFLSLQPSHARLRDASFALLFAAAPVRVAAAWAPQFGRYGWTENAAYISTFALALGVVGAVAALRVFEGPAPDVPHAETPPAYGAMVRAAYAWLIAGAALDVYWRLREMDGGFTPMYAAGAIRHAFLLGFATLMMMAMAYRTVPVFSGRELRWPSLVPASFGLVATAAVLRVFPAAFATAPSKLDFKLMTAGGFLLFFGLAVFAAEMVSSMFGRRIAAAAAAAPAVGEPVAAPPPPAEREARVPTGGPTPGVLERPTPPSAAGPIRGDMVVADALRLSPLVLQVLLDYGFGPLADPEMRDRLAPTITIERAAAFVGADRQTLVDTLNMAVGQTRALGADNGAPIDFKLIETSVTEDALLAALKTCNDPEIPVNIVDLGLVHGVTVRDAYAHLTMTLTAADCPLAGDVEDDVRAALLKVPGIETVDIDIVKSPAWSPDRMSATARAAVGW
jgi:metal-sulfur cluster biosynthetic enzyme